MICMEHLWFAVFTVVTFVAWGSSKQVVLVDTAADSSKWFWEPVPKANGVS